MSDNDPFLWLEEIEGEAALAWVARQNARTLAALESDPRFDGLYRAALDVLTSADRIPYPAFLGDRLVNFWQDETHIRGLWRETSLASFLTPEPAWRPLLDIDALSAGEGRNWVFQGAASLPPEYRRALVSLSDGGKDAAEKREFDIAAGEFVGKGFRLPEGKQSAVWLDDDTLLVARDWGPGTMTRSGYPFVLKRLGRSMPLDSAVEDVPRQPRGCQHRRQRLARPGRDGARYPDQSSGQLLRQRVVSAGRGGPDPAAAAAALELSRLRCRATDLLARTGVERRGRFRPERWSRSTSPRALRSRRART